MLSGLPPSLQLQQLLITNCNTNQTDTLHTLVAANTWAITANDLTTAGIIDSALTGGGNSECIRIRAILNPTCAYLNVNKLPDLTITMLNLCGDTIRQTALRLPNANPQSLDTIVWNGHSDCSDCFTLTKTANTDTVAIGDTVTFTINVCSHNAAADTMYLTDLLPSSSVFTLYSATPPIPAYNTNFAADTCVNYIVKGMYKTTGNCPSAALQNKAVLTSGAAVYKDSVCVNVYSPCANAQVRWLNGTYAKNPIYASSLPYTNKSIYVEGLFYIDTVVTLNHCTVYTKAGAQIVVTSTGVLNLNNTTIQGCDTMWQGVALRRGKIQLTNGSIIKDANVGIYAENGSIVNIGTNSKVYDCVTGFFVPPLANSLNNITVSISNASFAMQATSFKPDYIGQPVHGTSPRAGIEVFGMPSLTIGGGVNTLNSFSRLNNGIIAHNSVVIVKNSTFQNIVIDTIYTEAYHGSTMVSVKDENIFSVPFPKLTVLPETQAFQTVNNSYRAIYTDGSVLTASYLNLLNVFQGIYGTRTPAGQTSMVSNCKITTSTTGIFWTNNAYAKRMIATSDTIIVNAPPITSTVYSKKISRGAIYMSETTSLKPVLYSATDNTIILYNAYYGISQYLTKQAVVKFNRIKIAASNLTFSTSGIILSSTLRANASCNNVKGEYPFASTTHHTYSFYSTLAERSYIGCNTTDSTITAIYFGGLNPVTRLRGNLMNRHFDGLYLNNVAVIDSQPHGGNMWHGPFTSFGAINLAPLPLVYKSSFLVDQNAYNNNNILMPFSVTPLGWFNFFPGNTFSCGSSALCNQPPPVSNTSGQLAELIASGNFQTTDYEEESKAMAEEYLYAELRADSALWVNDSIYAAFISANENGAVGRLYETRFDIEKALAFDSVFTSLLDNAANQTSIITDSLMRIDELAEQGNPIPNYETVRNQLRTTLEFLGQTVFNLKSQQKASMQNNLAHAELNNDLVVPRNLPEINSQLLNEMEIAFLYSGEDVNVIRNHLPIILPIAHQCPYAGGQAVDKARVYVAMVNDSEEFNDDDICLQSGIYRMANDSVVNTITEKQEVQLIPNPANDFITIKHSGIKEGVCMVSIQNALSQTVILQSFNCKKQEHKIDVSKLSPGVYSVKIDFEKSKSTIIKLIIQR